MNAVIEKALFHLTHNGNIAEANVDELKNLSTEYPYFATAQFLLAAKMKKDDHFLHDAQLQKASLFFNNLNWLHYQLHGDHYQTENSFIKKDDQISKTASIDESESPVEFWKEEPIRETNIGTEQEPSPTFSYTNPITIPTIENVREILNKINNVEEKNVEPETYPETIKEPVLKAEETSLKTSLPNYSDAFKNSVPNTEEEHIQEIAPRIFAFDSYENEKQEKKLSDILTNQLADSNKPVDKNAKLEFEMEPYYTIDYFASQGIKVDLTQQPQDKLTQQLLTFTDWLKKMKNTNPNPQDLGTDPELEKAIHGIANASNEAREIVTETMAEVFVKQGKVDKAVQLFIKLSFLEPEKSAYFAAKIQQLKGL